MELDITHPWSSDLSFFSLTVFSHCTWSGMAATRRTRRRRGHFGSFNSLDPRKNEVGTGQWRPHRFFAAVSPAIRPLSFDSKLSAIFSLSSRYTHPYATTLVLVHSEKAGVHATGGLGTENAQIE